VNLAVTLGSNMYAGAHALLTFPTRHPSHKVSTLPHHDNEQSLGLVGFLRKKANQSKARTHRDERNVTISFLLCTATGRKTLRGRTVYKKGGGGGKVIINHIYDAVREPT
jgi:hypothetical protein